MVEMLRMFMADVVHEEPVGDVTDASTFDTVQLGFMCGIEVHQQLATGKLRASTIHALRRDHRYRSKRLAVCA